jgi:N-acetylglucosamine-6-phosphate deacetylase
VRIVRGGEVMTPAGLARDVDVVIDGPRIAGLSGATGTIEGEVIDARGLTVAPGFVDVHVHGGGGFSLLGRDPDEMRAYARWVVRHGVTAFLIGAVGPTPERLSAQVEAGRLAATQPYPGSAEILGFHFEGPFISPARHGAFDPRSLRAPDLGELEQCLGAAGAMARLMTIAPELTGAEAVIRRAAARGMTMSMGHTDATLAQARLGFDWGIHHVTHCFNAMRPFGHRDPGPIGAALTADGVTCELIGDTLHVDPVAMDVLIRCKGERDTVLVTDGIQLAGSRDGSFSFGSRSVSIRGGVARLDDGTIAGSVTTMDANVRNVVALGVPLAAVLWMATENPARVAGAGGRKGSIAPGMDADLVLLDAGLQVRMTIARGEVVWRT